jgi:hypothetical protein
MPKGKPSGADKLREDIHDRVTRVETSMEALTGKVGDIASNLNSLVGVVRDQSVATTKMFQDQTAIINRQMNEQTVSQNKQFGDLALAIQQAQAPKRIDYVALCSVFSLLIVIGGLVLWPMEKESEVTAREAREALNGVSSVDNRTLTIENVASAARAEAQDDNIRIRALETDSAAQREKDVEIETQIGWMVDMHNAMRRDTQQMSALLFKEVFKTELPQVPQYDEGPSKSKQPGK